jgi:hypothetical protein
MHPLSLLLTTEAQRDGAATKRSSQKETKTGWSFAKNAEFSDIALQRFGGYSFHEMF